MNHYSSIVCDDFGVYAYTITKMELPSRRETVLHYFDSLRKEFPEMTEFDCREAGEYVLEEDREIGKYRWASLEPRRFCAGFFNPPSLDEADVFNERVLEIAPFHLDMSLLDCEAMDVVFNFDLNYSGNHDEVVADALGFHSPLEALTNDSSTKVLNFQPSLMLALDDSCRLQCRLNVETRTNPYQVRTGQFSEAPISVYFTIRQYWERQPFATLEESYQNQRRIGQQLVDDHIIPAVVKPLAQTINTR